MKRFGFLLIIVALLSVNSSAQTHPMRVGGQVGLGLPLGNLSDAYSAGFSINGLFIYNLQNQLDLTGNLGYMRLGSKVSGLDASFSTVPLLAGIRYSFAGSSAFTPYVGAELGLFFSSTTVSYDFGFFGTQTATASSTDFGFIPQAGFTYPLSPALTLDANLKFNIITGGGSETILGINAGVTYGL